MAVAAGMLFATGSSALVVPFEVANHGAWVCTGFPSGAPEFECYAWEQEIAPNALGITRVSVYLKGDIAAGQIWEGRHIYLTDDGDALFARVEGTLDVNTGTTDLEETFIGGTGIFAGASGSGKHYCTFHYPEWPCMANGTNECTGEHTLVLPDHDPRMVPMVAHEGDLVDLGDLLHVEREAYGLSPFPFLFQKATHTGIGTQLGLYSSEKLTVLDVSQDSLHGFFTTTAANGDTIDGYYEGAFSALADPDALGIDMQFWITGGTGRFEHASGTGNGSGTSWADGSQDLTLEGVMSAVGSSER
jgi:hypothetical protein